MKRYATVSSMCCLAAFDKSGQPSIPSTASIPLTDPPRCLYTRHPLYFPCLSIPLSKHHRSLMLHNTQHTLKAGPPCIEPSLHLSPLFLAEHSISTAVYQERVIGLRKFSLHQTRANDVNHPYLYIVKWYLECFGDMLIW